MVLFRNDDWNADRPARDESRGGDRYDGPSGMNVDGTIETNWHEVLLFGFLRSSEHNMHRFIKTEQYRYFIIIPTDFSRFATILMI